MATLAGTTDARPATLLTQEQITANKKAIDANLKVHQEQHGGFYRDCMICICRAIDFTEQGNKREADAHAFLATLPSSVIVNAVLAMRAELEDDNTSRAMFPWMFGGKYA